MSDVLTARPSLVRTDRSRIQDRGVLLLFHCRSNTGYAISSLERAFHLAGAYATGHESRVYYSYSSLELGLPMHANIDTNHAIETSYFAIGSDRARMLSSWVAERAITHALAFDLPIRSEIAPILRRAGVQRLVSYWGASISDVYPWYLRPMRRLQFYAARARPDHFVFESEGMRDRAVLGAGVPYSQTSVVYLGVDTEKFKPGRDSKYAHRVLGIPEDRRLVFFSGHMEPRKGVDVLIRAIGRMVETGRRDVHLLLAGDNPEDRTRLSQIAKDCGVEFYVTFAGYRSDVPSIHGSVDIGVIASTGWDSFTMSAVELSASGIPLVVSDLPGLREAVEPGVTGVRVRPGDVPDLARAISELLDDPERRSQYGRNARDLAVLTRSVESQSRAIASILVPQVLR